MRRTRLLAFLLLFVGVGASLRSQVISGLDVLKKNEFAQLHGKKVGLITNQTGLSKDGRSSIDILFEAPNLKLAAIFSPEHGVQGTEDRDTIESSVDPRTRLPVYSLYGKTRRPTSKMLEGLDVLVYDIQDVGVRYYTYITTMGYCMEEAARRGIKFLVLDRPVIINGSIVEGDLLPDTVRKFIAYYPIPTRYGMTPGELARFYNEEWRIGCNLEVIKMEGWRRTMWFDDARLRWVNPSPNIRKLDQAILYSGLGCFEATNLSVGRGTDHPFEYYGAPYLDGEELAKQLNEKGINGLKFSPVRFTPSTSAFENQECSGVRAEIIDRNQLRTTEAFVRMAIEIKRQTSQWNYHSQRFAEMAGSDFIINALDKNLSAEGILRVFNE
ncbi:MAG: DUF1343 domain-containing protein, partial [Bacteroidota bacterium]